MASDLADLNRSDRVAPHPGRDYLVDEEPLHVPAPQVAPAQRLPGAPHQSAPLQDAGEHGERREGDGEKGPRPTEVGEVPEGGTQVDRVDKDPQGEHRARDADGRVGGGAAKPCRRAEPGQLTHRPGAYSTALSLAAAVTALSHLS